MLDSPGQDGFERFAFAAEHGTCLTACRPMPCQTSCWTCASVSLLVRPCSHCVDQRRHLPFHQGHHLCFSQVVIALPY